MGLDQYVGAAKAVFMQDYPDGQTYATFTGQDAQGNIVTKTVVFTKSDADELRSKFREHASDFCEAEKEEGDTSDLFYRKDNTFK